MLKISDLSKRYGDLVAADRVSLTVPRGRVVGFVGPNGAGKSTTMRSVFGLVRPDAGTITWDGEPVHASHLNRFGYMPEQRGLYPKMSIHAQLGFFAELKGVDRKTALDRAASILESLDLGDRLGDDLEKLSHGNQQRVQLAVSLVTNPELLILDEPFNGLDPVAVNTLQNVLSDRVANGAGVLFSSHQLDLVERVCDEIVVIVEGTVRATGSVHDVRASTGVHYVTVEVDRPMMPLADAITLPVVSSTTNKAVVLVNDEHELDQILAQVRAVGTLKRFDYDLPDLQSVFTSIAKDQSKSLVGSTEGFSDAAASIRGQRR